MKAREYEPGTDPRVCTFEVRRPIKRYGLRAGDVLICDLRPQYGDHQVYLYREFPVTALRVTGDWAGREWLKPLVDDQHYADFCLEVLRSGSPLERPANTPRAAVGRIVRGHLALV